MPGPYRKKHTSKKPSPKPSGGRADAQRPREGRVIGYNDAAAAPAVRKKKRDVPAAPAGRPVKPRYDRDFKGQRGGKRRPPFRTRRSRLPPAPPAEHPEGERLQKVLAAAGFGSRRECEELITTGRVEIDRQIVMTLGTRVKPETQEIRVDGQTLTVGQRFYYAVNKPRGVVTTNWDPSGRPRVVDLVPDRGMRLFAVGRLDLSSEGLILVTNDGEMANQLTHPRYGIHKTYLVQVVGNPTPETLAQIRKGVHLAEGIARAEDITVKSHQKDSTWLEMVLKEGRNREVRRLLARVGHKVIRLVRITVGPIRLGKLPPGGTRPLTPQEIGALRALLLVREE